MAWTAKFTAQRGKTELKDVAIASGSSESQSDTISLNVDVTNITKGELLLMIDQVRDAVHAAKFPPA